ncbi:hypothetical protein BDV18DRAFT_142341 [Aspergillus unguis]
MQTTPSAITMYTKLAVSASITAGVCVPFYIPYTRSRDLSAAVLCQSPRRRKYPAIGPFFHIY